MGDKIKTKLVAEVSANHNQSLETCKEIIQAAKKAGATHVKLQTYKPSTMTLNLNTADYKISADHKLWPNEKLYNLYKLAHTPWEWHGELFNFAKKIDLQIFSTPFDITAVDFLEQLNCPIYKIASLETGDIELIKHISRTNKPIIASTGASTLDEIDFLVETIRSENNNHLTLLLCTSAYPTPLNQVNLNRMKILRSRYGLNVGLSDHTQGITSSIAAVALGATLIERHLTLNRGSGGPDSAFSLEPNEFAELSKKILEVESCLGSEEWEIQIDETESRRLRRSLIVTVPVKKGEVITHNNIKSLRPSIGIEPKFYGEIIGKKFIVDLNPGDPLTWDVIEKK